MTGNGRPPIRSRARSTISSPPGPTFPRAPMASATNIPISPGSPGGRRSGSGAMPMPPGCSNATAAAPLPRKRGRRAFSGPAGRPPLPAMPRRRARCSDRRHRARTSSTDSSRWNGSERPRRRPPRSRRRPRPSAPRSTPARSSRRSAISAPPATGPIRPCSCARSPISSTTIASARWRASSAARSAGSTSASGRRARRAATVTASTPPVPSPTFRSPRPTAATGPSPMASCARRAHSSGPR